MNSESVELKGYQTQVVLVAPTLRAPCPAHERPGWLDDALRAIDHGWPEGHPGGPWQADCADCQSTPPVTLAERVVGWSTNDPRVVAVSPTGAALDTRGVDPNTPTQEDPPR